MSLRERKEQLLIEKMWRKCAADEAYFIENFWRIRVPGRGLVPMQLRQAQAEALVHWSQHRYSLTLKARQIGWSTLIAAHEFWVSYFHPNKEILFISRGEREAIDLLKKAKIGYRNLPAWMVERGPKLLSEHQQQMPFDNGSVIKSLPSANHPARGSSADEIVVDEWAFLPNADEAWADIEPVADVGGNIRGLSTANGWATSFTTCGSRAEAGENKFATMFYPWSAVPERDEAWYEAQKRSMPAWQLAQEYPSSPEEAFIKSGRPIFDMDVLQALEPVEPERGFLHVYGR